MEEKNTATEAAAPKKSRHVLIISAAIVGVFVIFGAVAPEALNDVANVLFTVFTGDFGWLYLLTVFLMVVFVIFALMISFIRVASHEFDPPGESDDEEKEPEPLSAFPVQP